MTGRSLGSANIMNLQVQNPSYSLTYFNSPGEAAPIRILFTLANIRFQDNRIPLSNPATPQIPYEIEQKLPFGVLPILEFRDARGQPQLLSGDQTIGRFLARRFNFMGANDNDVEAAHIDEILEAIEEYLDKWRAVLKIRNDAEAKYVALTYAVNVATPQYLGALERILLANPQNQFLVGKSMSLADIKLATLPGFIQPISPVDVDVFSRYPKLKAHIYKIRNHPRIQMLLQAEKENNIPFEI